jgi:hypothetical protein
VPSDDYYSFDTEIKKTDNGSICIGENSADIGESETRRRIIEMMRQSNCGRNKHCPANASISAPTTA